MLFRSTLKLLDLAGRGFVVLGAGQGIGEQAAHALAQAGATVMCVDNDARPGRKGSRRMLADTPAVPM